MFSFKAVKRNPFRVQMKRRVNKKFQEKEKGSLFSSRLRYQPEEDFADDGRSFDLLNLRNLLTRANLFN